MVIRASIEDGLRRLLARTTGTVAARGAPDATVPETAIPMPPQYDWARDLHALQLQVLATLGDLDLLLVGDSLAQLWPLPKLWPWLTFGLGIGGDRTQQVLWRVDRIAWGACRPERILVVAGTNNLLNGDAAPDIAAGIEAIATRLAAALPETTIFVLLPPPLGPGLRLGIERRSALRALLATRFEGRLIDADAALGTDSLEPNPNYQADMVHLTEHGYEILTGLVRTACRPDAAAVPNPAGPRGPLLFLGDSITGHWGGYRPEFFAEHGFVCRGVGGETSGQVRARLARALAATGASGLHILCGINDIGHNATHADDAGSRDNIAAMLAVTRERGVRTWVGSITPAEWLVYGSIDPRARIAALNAWLRAHADQAGATYVDYHAVLATPSGALRPEYSEDGLHLSPAGYAAIEPVLLAALGD